MSGPGGIAVSYSGDRGLPHSLLGQGFKRQFRHMMVRDANGAASAYATVVGDITSRGGAFLQHPTTPVDVWRTVCDVQGSGWFIGAFGFDSSAVRIEGLLIEIDGVTYRWDNIPGGLYQSPYWGVTEWDIALSSTLDPGNLAIASGPALQESLGIQALTDTIVAPRMFQALPSGMAFRFESMLRILHFTSVADATAAAIYRLDP